MQFLTILSLAVAAISAAPLNITDAGNKEVEYRKLNATELAMIQGLGLRNNTADITSVTFVGETTNANTSVFVVPESLSADILSLIKSNSLNSTTYDKHTPQFSSLELNIAQIASNSTLKVRPLGEFRHDFNGTHDHNATKHHHNGTEPHHNGTEPHHNGTEPHHNKTEAVESNLTQLDPSEDSDN